MGFVRTLIATHASITGAHKVQTFLSCTQLHANPWLIFGEPVAALCSGRCINATNDDASACHETQDLVSCGNTRERTGALDYLWSGGTDPACDDGPQWQLYRQLERGRRNRREYPSLACAELQPKRYIASLFGPSTKRATAHPCIDDACRLQASFTLCRILDDAMRRPMHDWDSHTDSVSECD